jgi:carbon starvation protein CstA
MDVKGFMMSKKSLIFIFLRLIAILTSHLYLTPQDFNVLEFTDKSVVWAASLYKYHCKAS